MDKSWVAMILFAVAVTMTTVNAGPTIYKVDENANEAEAVMVPVWSTAIPLEDLPKFKVEAGFGLIDKSEQKKKIQKRKKNKFQLITSKNKHRFVAPAGVFELSKEEFENFNL